LLSSTYVVAFQVDVIRQMLQQPILSGKIGKWAYALIEYDLAYEPLKSMKGQVVADFILDIVLIKTSMNHIFYCQFIHVSYSLMVLHVEKVKV
jgi:hypothetical protein